jgi:hypothetical protein
MKMKSTSKLWLTLVATHLNLVELPCKDPYVDVSSLFGSSSEPCGEHTSISITAELF